VVNMGTSIAIGETWHLPTAPPGPEPHRYPARRPEVRAAVVADLLAERWTCEEIGARWGVNRQTVNEWRKAHGVPRRPKPSRYRHSIETDAAILGRLAWARDVARAGHRADVGCTSLDLARQALVTRRCVCRHLVVLEEAGRVVRHVVGRRKGGGLVCRWTLSTVTEVQP